MIRISIIIIIKICKDKNECKEFSFIQWLISISLPVPPSQTRQVPSIHVPIGTYKDLFVGLCRELLWFVRASDSVRGPQKRLGGPERRPVRLDRELEDPERRLTVLEWIPKKRLRSALKGPMFQSSPIEKFYHNVPYHSYSFTHIHKNRIILTITIWIWNSISIRVHLWNDEGKIR